MKIINEIAQLIKENPNCVIYYHNQEDWVIYKNKYQFEKASEDEDNCIMLAEGHDDSGQDYTRYVDEIISLC